jgi:excisionase family DNA binding protein
MTGSDLITITEAAEAFDIPRIKLYRWMKSGRLQARRSGRDERVKLVSRADVAALLGDEPIEIENASNADSRRNSHSRCLVSRGNGRSAVMRDPGAAISASRGEHHG